MVINMLRLNDLFTNLRRILVRTTKSNHSFLLSALMALLLFAIGGEIIAQTFENNGSCVYSAGTNGIIRMRAPTNTGQFTGTNPLGATALARIPGRVEWSNAAPGQVVQARWYTDLFLTGGAAATKQVPDAVYVYKTYDPSAAGTRSYAGTFHYDRDVAAEDQLIYPENGASAANNSYNALDLIGAGTKTVAWVSGAGGEVHVDDNLSSDAAVSLRVYDDMRINRTGATQSLVNGAVVVGDGTNNGNFFMNVGDANFASTVTVQTGSFNIDNTGNGTFDGVVTINTGSLNLNGGGDGQFNANVNINNGGTLLVNNAGNANFEATTAVAAGGTLKSTNSVSGVIDFNPTSTLALANAANSLLDLGQNTTMYIGGIFTNGFDARTNMNFGTGSTVAYDGDGQGIMSTAQAKPYQNLTIGGGAGTNTPVSSAVEPDIWMVGNFDMGATDVDILDMASTDVVFHMTNGLADYGPNTSEVRGKFRRSGVGAGTYYAFNNLRTLVNFSTAPAGWFQMDVRPDTWPNIQAAVSPIHDVKRKITLASNNGGAGNWGEISSLRVGYLPTEYVTGSDPNREDKMRMLEGDGGDRFEKITTGIPIPFPPTLQRELAGSASGWSSLEMLGGNGADEHYIVMRSDATRGTMYEMGQGHDVVLTDQTGYLISIRNGRWSADNTWDEGRPPMHDEDALIRHIVYTGMDNGPFGSSVETRDEDAISIDPSFTPGNTEELLCNSVTLAVVNSPAVTGPNVALVIGNTDTGLNANMNYIFGTQAGLNNGLFNNNNTCGNLWDENFGSYANLQGIHVLTAGVGRSTNMRTSQLTNEGRITNNGVIEIGD